MMRRRAFAAGAFALTVLPFGARAQQPGRVPRIAYLSSNPAGDFRSLAFREGLRDFGYTEGTDIVIEYFLAPTNADLPQWAAMAVAAKPDLIVGMGTLAIVAVKDRTATIPIVFANVSYSVELGLVANLARPGGNLTGTADFQAEVAAKRLQMLSDLMPGIERVAFLYASDQLQAQFAQDEILIAARILKIDVRMFGVKTAADLAPAIASAASGGAQAIQISGAPIFSNNIQLVADEVRKHRLPSMAGDRLHPAAGGLISYGNVQGGATFRRAAYYVDRILKGAKPADLPVEQPMLFELVVNKKTADMLGLKIPESLLVSATEVIE